MRKNLNQSGFAHAGLAIFAVIAVMAIGLVGYNVSNQSSENTDVLGAKSSKTAKSKSENKVRYNPGGGVQFVVREQVIDSKGKKKLIPRGNVPVELTATNKHQSCRDAGKKYVREGDVVFAGKTDADKDHKKNLGKIKADRCLVGKYTATLKLSDKYVFVGASSKDINVKKGSIKKASFTIAKKQNSQGDGNTQSSDVVPTPAPAPTKTVPLTAEQEKVAIDRTVSFERDMFVAYKTTTDLNEDMGAKIADRKAAFTKNSSTYMTPNLIAKVNNTLGGDAFPLLGISDLKIGQYQKTTVTETKAIVTDSTATTAVVEHGVTVQARSSALGNMPKANDVSKTWVYGLVRDGQSWKIGSIEVKSN